MRLKPLALVVDDDPVFRRMLEALLPRLGLLVRTAETGEAFLELSVALEPDIYLIDLQIGAESGLSLIQALRSGAAVDKPIVVTSGVSARDMVSHALELGASDYLLKPFDKSLLVNKLARFVKTNELEEQERFVKTHDGNGARARVAFKGRVAAVDELGMGLISSQLASKGSVLRLTGDFLKEIDPEKEECLLFVTSTQLRAKDGDYEIYAEFDGADTNFLQAVRRWLSFVSSKKAA